MSAPMSHQARDLAASREHAPHRSMLLRMLVRAAILRRGRATSALFAMVVAAAVATAMLNLYVDVQAKLRREFRNYGANIILVGKNGASLPAESLSRVDSVLAGHGYRSAIRLGRCANCRWTADRGRGHGFRPRAPTEQMVVRVELAFNRGSSAGGSSRPASGLTEEPTFRAEFSGKDSAGNSGGHGSDRSSRG